MNIDTVQCTAAKSPAWMWAILLLVVVVLMAAVSADVWAVYHPSQAQNKPGAVDDWSVPIRVQDPMNAGYNPNFRGPQETAPPKRTYIKDYNGNTVGYLETP